MTDPTLAAAFSKAYEAADKLGLTERLFRKLVNSPDAAAKNLSIALSEVRRTFDALRDTLLELTYLGVEGQEEIDIRRTLDRIEHGALLEIVLRGKGSCHKISNIYDRHLSGWFSTVFNSPEQEQLRLLFNDLRDSDGWAVDAAERLVHAAIPVAQQIRAHLDARHRQEAIRTAETFARGLRGDLAKVSQTVAFMSGLEADFIKQQGIAD